MALPPGPSESAWSQIWQYFRDPHVFFERCARDHGDAFTMRYPGNAPLVVFSHPSAVKEIFAADPDVLRAGDANAILRNVVGDTSLFVLDGAPHDHRRRATLRLLQNDMSLKAVAHVAARGVQALPRGCAFAAHGPLEVVTLDLLLGAIMAASPPAVVDALRVAVLRFGHLAVSPATTLAAMVTPPGVARALSARLPRTRALRALDDVRRVLLGELARRRRVGVEGDLFTALMALRNEDGRALGDEALCDQALTLILAGHETSATTLAWAAHHLAVDEAVQRELRVEVASHPLESCVLLDAFLKETLRVAPVVPVIPRRLARPMPIGGHALPAGTSVALSPYLTHHREDCWERPFHFEPRRFLARRIDPFVFFPFGGGARRCVGMAFSMTLMKIVLAEMVRSRRWLLAVDGSRQRRGLLVAPAEDTRVVALDT